MTKIHELPVPQGASATDKLTAAARRDFQDVLILGFTADGKMRHASTMSRKVQLWWLEYYRLQLLGIVDGIERVTDDEEPTP